MITEITRHRLNVAGRFMLPFLLFFVTMLFACKGQQSKFKSPEHYNFKKPFVIKLPSELNEISGIVYYAKDNSIFCHSDELGNIYKIFLDKPKDIKKWKFGKVRDYEDMVLHDSIFYVLSSSGDIVAVSFLNDSVTANKYEFPESGKFEFETLYYEPQQDKLILICKDCGKDDKTQFTSAYAFDYKTFTYTPAYTIDGSRILEITGTKKSVKFKPSAAAISPLDNKLYIIASVNKVLVVAGRNGVVEHIYPLDPEVFHHPEGITFNNAGDVFISNEFEEPKSANILFYKHKKNDDK